jgi:ubiquinone/menaquinone biosynthesis C-methylase UbiE
MNTLNESSLKTRQQAVWATGDYAVIGTTLQIVGEQLAEACDVRWDERVLDVAAGNGNATLAAARRGAKVTATDFVPALLERASERARAERLEATCQVADAEELPFADAAFDVVLSTFGVMFAAEQARAAAELVRVCRPGGRIGLANWTPRGFIGQMFELLGRRVPRPPGAPSPMRWGDESYLHELFGADAHSIVAVPRTFNFRYRSAVHFVEVFRAWYGPLRRTLAGLPHELALALECELIALLQRSNRGGEDALVVPSEYLEVVITRR